MEGKDGVCGIVFKLYPEAICIFFFSFSQRRKVGAVRSKGTK